jgi:hypothetical protein
MKRALLTAVQQRTAWNMQGMTWLPGDARQAPSSAQTGCQECIFDHHMRSRVGNAHGS